MIALIYGSTTGNTEDIAKEIQQLLGEELVDLHDVKDTGLEILEAYDQFIFAIPTWDYGEVQEDWAEVWEELDTYDMSGKIVAFVGLGDQYGYAEWFLDAMGMLHDKVVARGATAVGYWPVDGYEFDESKALTEDKKQFVGLGIDQDGQDELTEERLEKWCAQVSVEMGLED